jgi:hypothetical protein
MIFAKTKKFCQNILIFTIFLYEAKTQDKVTSVEDLTQRVFHFQLVHQVLSRLWFELMSFCKALQPKG